MRKDCDFDTAKGGFLLAFKNNLVATNRSDLNADCEIVWTTIQIQGSKQITIGALTQIYGATSNYLEQLHTLLHKIKKNRGGQVWLAGRLY